MIEKLMFVYLFFFFLLHSCERTHNNSLLSIPFNICHIFLKNVSDNKNHEINIEKYKYIKGRWFSKLQPKHVELISAVTTSSCCECETAACFASSKYMDTSITLNLADRVSNHYSAHKFSRHCWKSLLNTQSWNLSDYHSWEGSL